MWLLITTQVCVQLPTYADNVALPTFAHHMALIPGQHQQTCSSGFVAVGLCWDRQTGGQTLCHYIDPAPHIMHSFYLLIPCFSCLPMDTGKQADDCFVMHLHSPSRGRNISDFVAVTVTILQVNCLWFFVAWQSRLVRNTIPTFIWGVRRDCVDPRFLTKEQIINHFGHASFTTKV